MEIIRIIALFIISIICLIAQYNTVRIVFSRDTTDKFDWKYIICYVVLETLFWIMSYTAIMYCKPIWGIVVIVVLVYICGARNGDANPKTNFTRMMFEQIFILLFIRVINKMPQILRNVSWSLFILIVAENVIMLIYAIMSSNKRPDK